jgi:hypothetical protein
MMATTPVAVAVQTQNHRTGLDPQIFLIYLLFGLGNPAGGGERCDRYT